MESILQPPQGSLRKRRSEAEQEYYQSKWFHLVLKLLRVRKGPFNIPLAPSITSGTPTECPHPESQVVKGRNQYGLWTKCLMCTKKLTYEKYGPGNPKPSSRKAKPEPVVPPEVVRKAKQQAKALASSSLEPPMTRGEMQNILAQHTQGLISSLSQTITPLVNNQAQLQQQMNQLGYAAASSMESAQQLPLRPQLSPDVSMLQNPNEENEWEVAP